MTNINYKVIANLDEPPLINFDTKGLNTQVVSLQNKSNNFKLNYKKFFDFVNFPHDIENIIFNYLRPITTIKCAYLRVKKKSKYYLSYIIAFEVISYYLFNIHIKIYVVENNDYIIFKKKTVPSDIKNIRELISFILNIKQNDIFFGKLCYDIYKRRQIIKSLVLNSQNINKIFIIDKKIGNPLNILIISKEKIYIIEQQYETELQDILTYVIFDTRRFP
jgi:hypothetical protein